ncbi:MAG: RecX family transcriptional regulator [Oscillospiraceae bacterium]|nr:RecX family transcriptional regulator [Oscillospiraceae bacterium]
MIEEIVEFDKLKTKVLKYIMYKKRTEREIRQKFAETDQDMLEEVIENLKELEYIDDNVYVDKAVKEFMRLKNLSLKELKYKLLAKGLNSSLIQDYMDKNSEELCEYEVESAKNIVLKKSKGGPIDSDTMQELSEYLNKKGYKAEAIKGAIDE